METKGTTIHGEMVTIAINFTDFTGRYMYHCHLLEHKDHEMMRSFVVLPEKIMEASKWIHVKGISIWVMAINFYLFTIIRILNTSHYYCYSRRKRSHSNKDS